jgi:endonuclease/exonuclease/phosphatase (EEP) superfamily protein YafD
MIWAGDFNTWSRGRMEFLMNIAEKLGLEKIDFSYDPRFLKLDHILYR